MSRRKLKTLKSENLRKEKRMILKGAMTKKKWGLFCQWLARMGRIEREDKAGMYEIADRTHRGRRVLRAVAETGQGE